MWFGALPAIFPGYKAMFVVMRVPRDRHAERTLLDQSIETLAIVGVDERYVHHDDNQLLFRNQGQVPFYECQLFFTQPGTVRALFARLGDDPFDVVQYQEVNRSIVKGIVLRKVIRINLSSSIHLFFQLL